MIAKVTPIIDPDVRQLCRHPYPGHRNGCPNFSRRATCPPYAPLFDRIIDMAEPVFAIWTIFDLKSHIEGMKLKHPDWSKRQLECCLYWQGRARKNLENEIHGFCWDHFLDAVWDGNSGSYTEPLVIRCPEATGINVTETMKSIGEILEWPPTTKTYQVAIIGTAWTL